MNLEPPAIVFYVITVAVVVAWLFALQFMLRTTRRPKSPGEEERETEHLGTTAPQNLIAGSAEIAGSPADLAAKAAAFLAKGPVTLGPVKIIEQTDDRVLFEGLGPAQPGGGVQLFSRGELRFSRIAQNRTRVDYAVEVPPRSWLLTLGWLFVGLGLLAIVVGFLVIQLFVLDAALPGVRWQSVQMVQSAHFVWPPFLFGGIYRRLRGQVRTSFDTLVHNLPYHEA